MSGGGARGGGRRRPRGLARGVALSVALSVVWREQRGVTGPTPVPDLTNHTTRRVGPRRRFAPYTQITHTSTTALRAWLRDRVHLPLSPIF